MRRVSGQKYDSVILTKDQVAQLIKEGKLYVQTGIWDDGTPTFTSLVMKEANH